VFNKAKPLAVLAAALAIFLLLVSWSLTTPVGGYPDDSFHFANIWCDEGLSGYVCEDVEGGLTRLVPNVFTEGSPWWEATGRGENLRNPEGAYPTFYYAVMKPFAGENVVTSVFVMRVVNMLLATVLIGLAGLLLPRRLRVAFGLSWLVAGAGLGLYYVASSHPLSWLYLGTGTLWAFVVAAGEAASWRTRVTALVGAVIATAITLGARPEGQLAAVLSACLGVGIFATGTRMAGFWERWKALGGRYKIAALGGVALLSVALLTFASRGSSAVTSGALQTVRNKFGSGMWNQFVDLPLLYAYVAGSNVRITEVGTFGPQTILLVGAAVAVVLIGVSRAKSNQLVLLLLCTAVLVVAPFAFKADGQLALLTPPRYLVPYLMLFVAAAIARNEEQAIGQFLPWKTLGPLLVVGHSLALHSAIRPYQVGSTPEWQLGLNAGLKWWWQVGPSPQTVWLIGSAVFAGLLFLVSRLAPKPIVGER
jgi:hypothetical protein